MDFIIGIDKFWNVSSWIHKNKVIRHKTSYDLFISHKVSFDGRNMCP